jgi:Spy/CpxP family protein refolding chaperone
MGDGMRNALWAGLALVMGCLTIPCGLSAETLLNAKETPTSINGTNPRHNSPQRRADISRLKLSDQQRQQVLDMNKSYSKRLSDLRCKLRQKKADRQKEMQQPTPDKEKLQQLSQEIGQIHGQIIVEDTNSRLDFEKILTPQQLEEWKKIRNERQVQNPEGLPNESK